MPYGADFKSLGICPDCQNKYEPVIITPTLLKDYANPYLKLSGRKPREKLRQTDDVVFIGYSLPDADKDLCDMFVRAIQSNHSVKGKKPRSITVVDDAQGFLDQLTLSNAIQIDRGSQLFSEWFLGLYRKNPMKVPATLHENLLTIAFLH